MRATCCLCTTILFICSLSVVNSMAIQTANPRTSLFRAKSTTNTLMKKRFRIRRTRQEDLEQICSMLAQESTLLSESWNDRMHRLRVKSILHKQIMHRLQAVEEARRTAHRVKQQYTECTDEETCHLLWSNETVRKKIESAVSNSQERNAWQTRGFHQSPDPEMLNHCLLSVEDHNGVIVGFTEIAWLRRPFPTTSRGSIQQDRVLVPADVLDFTIPSCEETDDSYCHIEDQPDETKFAPAIINLVTASSHRRMGIASRLLHFCHLYTLAHWRCSEIGLYVHHENEQAKLTYLRRGFSVVSDKDGLLYMMLKRKCK